MYMELYKLINLPTELVNDIQQAAWDEVQNHQFTGLTRCYLQNPRNILNAYLAEKYPKIPNTYVCILFYRDKFASQQIHVDSTVEIEGHYSGPLEMIHCALNIPLSNCEDTAIQWYKGQYTVVTSEGPVFNNVNGHGATRKFLAVKWANESTPTVFDEIVVDNPTLVKIDIPHAVTATDTARMCMSFRFLENITFESAAAILT
jgi:hypothetical protein